MREGRSAKLICWGGVLLTALLIVWRLFAGPHRDGAGHLPQDVARMFIESVQLGDYQKAASYWISGDIKNVEANWQMDFESFCKGKFKCQTYELIVEARGKRGYRVLFRGLEAGKSKSFGLYLEEVDKRWLLGMDNWGFYSKYSPGENTAAEVAEKTLVVIEACERLEPIVLAQFSDGGPENLNHWYAAVIVRGTLFAGGKIELSRTEPALILDEWKNPLEMRLKSSFSQDPRLVRGLLTKTNRVLIWSIGIDRSNEFGGGDDVFSRE